MMPFAHEHVKNLRPKFNLAHTFSQYPRDQIFKHTPWPDVLADADQEPPELKSATPAVERRSWPIQGLEIRQVDGEPATITGYAAVFDSPSQPLGGGAFVEKVRRGAFKKTIKEADVRALWNHDPNYVLGRNTAGTLSLAEDQRGLAVEIKPPDTQWSRDLMTTMQRGDVDQMSFGFQIVQEAWNQQVQPPERTLTEVKLFDVSVVTFPAYPATEAAVRSAIDVLRGYLPPEPSQDAHSAQEEPPTIEPEKPVVHGVPDLAVHTREFYKRWLDRVS